MADEVLYNGIVNLGVFGAEESVKDLQQYFQQVSQVMEQIGGLSVSSTLGTDFARDLERGRLGLEQLTQGLQEYRTRAGTLEVPGAEAQLRNLDALITKTEQLRRVQALPAPSDPRYAVASAETRAFIARSDEDLRRQQPSQYGTGLAALRREDAVRRADRQEGAAGENVSKAQEKLDAAMSARAELQEQIVAAERALLRAEARLEVEVETRDRYVQGVRDYNERFQPRRPRPELPSAQQELDVRRAERELAEVQELRASLGRVQADVDAQIAVEQDKVLAAERQRAEVAQRSARIRDESAAGARADAEKGAAGSPDLAALETQASQLNNATANPLLKAQEDLARALENEAIVARTRYDTAEERDRAGNAALAQRQGAENRLAKALEAEAKAEERLAQEAQREAEARRVRGDDRRRVLLSDSDEFLANRGITPEGSSKSQQLAIEQQQLTAARARLLEQAQGVDNEKDLNRLLTQRETIERRILANAEAIERQRYTERGRGGFVGGLFGDFGGSPQGVRREDLTFQLGQATKFYALYTGLSLIQRGIEGLITVSAEYSQAQADLAIAMHTSTEGATAAAQEYAQIGAELGTGPAIATQGAAKFIRTFRDEPQGETGRAGAQIASYVNVLEGADRVENVTQDLISLLRGFGLQGREAQRTYDQAQVISQRFGYSAGEVLPGAAAIADLGKESGYSLPQIIALVASVMQQTGTTSDAVAGDLKRVLGSQDSPQMNALFERFNVSLDLTFQQRLDALYERLQGLSPEERARVVTSVGDPRTSAAAAALINTIAQQREGAQAGLGAAGAVDAQTRQKLNTLGGALEKFVAQLQNAAIQLGGLGITDLLTDVVQAGTLLAQGLGALSSALGAVPGPLLEVVAGVLALRGAARGASVARRAFAGSELLAPLIGGAAGASAGAAASRTSATELAALQRRAQVAAAAGNTALASSLAAEATAARTAAASTTTFTARVAGAGAAALAAAPQLLALAAAVGGFILLSQEIDNYQKGKKGSADANRAYDRSSVILEAGAKGASLFDVQANIGDIEAAQALIRDSSSGAGGWLADKITPGLKDSREAALQRLQDRRNALSALYHQLDEDAKLLNDASAPEEFFGQGFSRFSYGIDKIKQQGIGADSATSKLRSAVEGASFDKLFPTVEGEKGAEDLVKTITERISRQTNPLEQQASYGKLRNALAELQARTRTQGGTAEQQDAAARMVEEANRLYLDSLISNVQARIDNIKSTQKDNAKSRNAIRGLITGALKETTGAGDVGATVKLLQGVDQAFLNTFRQGLIAQRAILQDQLKSLKTAAAAARVDAAYAREVRAGLIEGVNPGEADTSDIGRSSVKDTQEKAKKARIDAINRMIQTLDAAGELTNFQNSSFEWPKDSEADKGPTAEEIALARLAAEAIPGDQYSQATTNLKIARYQLSHAKDQKEYYDALKALRDAQYELGKLELERANNARLLRIDITDPVAQARAQVQAARDQLRFDQQRGATSGTLMADRVGLRQAEASAANTAWQQRFSDWQTNFELQRVSLTSYLRYLNTQKQYLENVKNKTRDQVEQLNQVDRALKGLADSLQGQFNLGDIRIPTVYEMRRSLAAGGSSVTTNYIQVNGADTRAVLDMLAGYLGQATVQAASTTPAKV